jgi:hypothetical protein
MPVPLPGPDEVLLTRPSAEEAQAVAVGLAAAAAHPDGLTDLQRILLEAVTTALTDHPIDLAGAGPVTPDELAALLRRRNLEFRTRVVQLMVLAALVLRPLPAEVAARVEAFAAALGVDEGMVAVARRFAAGSLGLAAVDFERNGYTRDWAPGDRHELHTSGHWPRPGTWPSTTRRWPPGGRRWRTCVWQLYAARGFVFPGLPGSAPPLLAQHDWVHVLADYGTTVESELEVFSLVARANDDMRAFSLMAMVVSLFETGYLRRAAGLFQYDPGHLSGGSAAGRDMAVRVADAMTRGAWCHDNATGADSIDFLRIDWLALADRPVDEVRDRFSLRPRSAGAVAAGSAAPWEPGGISPFQLSSGREAAARAGRPYDSFGAEVTPSD